MHKIILPQYGKAWWHIVVHPRIEFPADPQTPTTMIPHLPPPPNWFLALINSPSLTQDCLHTSPIPFASTLIRILTVTDIHHVSCIGKVPNRKALPRVGSLDVSWIICSSELPSHASANKMFVDLPCGGSLIALCRHRSLL